MKSILAVCFALLILSSCREDEGLSPGCNTMATVRNLNGLDGCGWVLELEDGEYLEFYLPVIGQCATPPYPDSQIKEVSYSSPWEDIAPQDGMKVRVDYDVLEDYSSVCMVGNIVEITCLEVIEQPKSD